MRICREPAHRFQCRCRILLRNGDAWQQSCRQMQLSLYILNIQNPRIFFFTAAKRTAPLTILPVSRSAYHFHLRITETGEFSAKHASGIYTIRAVHGLHLFPGRMPVNDRGRSPVIRGPVSPDRKARIVCLPSGVSIETKGPDPAGYPADVLLPDSRM